jgi:transcriptional regulator
MSVTDNTNIFDLSREKQVALVRLILKGEKQEVIAEKFDVTQGYVSQVKTKFFDGTLKAYRDEKLLKREVAEQIGLQCEEIDQDPQKLQRPSKLHAQRYHPMAHFRHRRKIRQTPPR